MYRGGEADSDTILVTSKITFDHALKRKCEVFSNDKIAKMYQRDMREVYM